MSEDPAEPRTLTLLAGGDVGPVVQPVDRLPELVAPLLRSADVRFAQCERTYSTRGFLPSWTTIPNGRWSRLDPEYASVFRAAGIDVVSLASNHALDWSYEPLFDTIDLFRSWGMRVSGAGRDEAEARRPAIVEHNGVRLAILSYCSVLRDGQAAADGAPGIAGVRVRTWYEMVDFQPGTPPLVRTEALAEDVAAVQRDVRAARERADAVVVSLHWGLRHVPKVLCEYQAPLGHAILDAGADVIIGHHPHTPKAVETYRDRVCFYSIGNFLTTGSVTHREKPNARWNLYWYEWHRDDTLYGFPEHCRMALLPKLTFGTSGLVRAAVVPVYINNLAQPEPVAPGTPRFQQILDHLEWVSDQFPHRFEVSDGEIVVHRAEWGDRPSASGSTG
jgi:poly-gamma-glutamate synthesis protein (capsule biosynthesis protein)